ncbi:basic proline-rich protein-like [Panicum virgatum]|uniref:basic proline-rich protein-like n=1 Tax=Panicum virgatum TaxID=38727 RepID=UPI0019D5C2FA|nr:basic proline-rich protein-like [Panicum virgatum]
MAAAGLARRAPTSGLPPPKPATEIASPPPTDSPRPNPACPATPERRRSGTVPLPAAHPPWNRRHGPPPHAPRPPTGTPDSNRKNPRVFSAKSMTQVR